MQWYVETKIPSEDVKLFKSIRRAVRTLPDLDLE